MKIIIGKTSGFCCGVKNAVEKTLRELEETYEPIYCLGELVHNQEVLEYLKAKGLQFVEKIEETKGKTIIRAHGIPKETYQKAKEKNIELIDLTCPSVLKIHQTVQKYAEKDYYIFLIGKKDHPEIIGTYSYCGKNSNILSNIEEVEDAIKKLKKSKLKHILIISQTTFQLKTFEEIVNKIKENVATEIEVKNTICLTTQTRQKEVKEISQKVDGMIIVGGKNSANTNKLYEIARKNCKTVLFVENKQDLEIKKIKNKKTIGIMAGASTPQKSVDEIINLLKTQNTKAICEINI